MKILLIGMDLDTQQIRTVLAKEGCTADFVSSRRLGELQGQLFADAVIIGQDHGYHGRIEMPPQLKEAPFVAAIGADNIAAGLSNLSVQENALCNQYILYGGEENLRRMVQFIAYKLGEAPCPPPPEAIPFDSIYDFEGGLYPDAAAYLNKCEQGYSTYVGILSYRTRWQGKDLAVERALKEELNRQGIGVIPAYSTGNPDAETGCLSMEQAVERFFIKEGKSQIELLVNFLFFGAADGDGESLFERAANLYNRLGIPVVHPVQSNYLNNEQWERSPAPFGSDSAINFDVAELQGMIEPVFLGGIAEGKMHDVVPERAQKLARRIAGWIALRKKTNAEKKIAVMLNNAVCSGVEATLGKAAGLNAFESIVKLLNRLAAEGYCTGEIPPDGASLRKAFLEKKAYSDFRWTSAEDIAACGGVLYAMPAQEYESLYAGVPEQARRKMEKTWGKAPGEAMVLDGKILITGMQFGNVLLMIQPKRGCYGAKCTGEVCKILQNPDCPPTHQFLATYFYAEKVFGADAWIHFGTHGCLEFLPGKSSGLGAECFSDIAVGAKPNLYVYNAESVSSAMLAKRRSYAVTIDHAAEQEGLHVLDEREIQGLLTGLSGGFIRPGAGGTAEDGPVETGRNLFGVEIDRIPEKTAYARGTQAAEALVASYLKEEGRYPEQIALNMISLDIPRTKGEQFSLLLSLIGVRPIWNERGIVTGMELIPLAELKRPRMDVSIHISGILRDTWPDILARMDAAVMMAAAAPETREENYIIRHLEPTEAPGEIPHVPRIFGGAPGTYANSIGLALKASAWQDENDLARYFIDSSSYVYGKDIHGEKNIRAFISGIKYTDATCDIVSLRHTDALISSYSARVQGGYALAAKSLGIDHKVHSYMGESTQGGIAVKTLREHVNEGLERTLLNEEWKKCQMAQGYDGAAEIMRHIQSVFEMQCVNESFTSQTLDCLARQYMEDETMRQFLQENNPFAAEESSRRFLELESRGKWSPAPDVLAELRKAYLKAEGNLEDGLCGRGEIQGGNVEIVADGAIAEWKERLQAADAEIKRCSKQNS
jgi:cobalamin biosynthesis Mg chelatase CobN